MLMIKRGWLVVAVTVSDSLQSESVNKFIQEPNHRRVQTGPDELQAMRR